jgi:hypothetical protein
MDRMAAMQPISLQFYAIAARHATIRQHLRAYFADYRALMEEVIQRGIAQGELRADISPAETAVTLTALLEGLALLWLIDPQATDWHVQVESSTQLLIQGLSASPRLLP